MTVTHNTPAENNIPEPDGPNEWAAYGGGLGTGPDTRPQTAATAEPQDSPTQHIPAVYDVSPVPGFDPNTPHDISPTLMGQAATPDMINPPYYSKQPAPQESRGLSRRALLGIGAGGVAGVVLGAVGVGYGLRSDKGNPSTNAANPKPTEQLPSPEPSVEYPPLQPSGPPVFSSLNLLDTKRAYPGNEGYELTVDGQNVVLPLLIETSNESMEMLYKKKAYTPNDSGDTALSFMATAVTLPQGDAQYANFIAKYTNQTQGTDWSMFNSIRGALWTMGYGLQPTDDACLQIYDELIDQATFERRENLDGTVTIALNPGSRVYWRLTKGRPYPDPGSYVPAERGGRITAFKFTFEASDPSLGSGKLYREVGPVTMDSLSVTFQDNNGQTLFSSN